MIAPRNTLLIQNLLAVYVEQEEMSLMVGFLDSKSSEP